jgi:hypothetical protein
MEYNNFRENLGKIWSETERKRAPKLAGLKAEDEVKLADAEALAAETALAAIEGNEKINNIEKKAISEIWGEPNPLPIKARGVWAPIRSEQVNITK